MRNLPPLLALLTLFVLSIGATAQATPLSLADPAQPFVSFAEEEEAEEEDETGDAAEEAQIEREICEEDPELCEEEEPTPTKAKPKTGEDECLLKGAKAAVSVNPGKRRLRLTVHYKTREPATVSVAASLEGPKGVVHLGTDHARFRRSGVYRDTFGLSEKQTKKALGAREFSVQLHVVNAPASCDVELSGASRRARR
ncbi:MAG TPA: hypothetical protein VFT79_07245 [Solirubrobacterales bacterium]|nr:hypothetical protein [Solirubrobacterales bacterium]